MADVLEELRWRGLINQATDLEAIERLLATPQAVYCGFDPSAESLHIGNLVPLLGLRRFQLAGHTPIALIGGATGLIGDPSGKAQERELSLRDDVAARAEKIGAEIRRHLPVQEGAPEPVFVNNLDWFGQQDAIGFLRDVGKHFSVRAMISKASVRERLQGDGPGISFAEFSYQLIQANDFIELARRHGCRMQIGGADQWGNMTAGLDLAHAHRLPSLEVLTFPLITMSDGRKFGKSEKGAVHLSAERTSEWEFFQFWMNTPDADAGRFLRTFTFLAREDVEALERDSAAQPHQRIAQRALALEVTAMIHGRPIAEQIAEASSALFGRAAELATIPAAVLDSIMRSAPSVPFTDGLTVGDALLAAQLASSRSDARRLTSSGGVSVNGHPVDDVEATVESAGLLHDRYAILRRGKRNYAILRRG